MAAELFERLPLEVNDVLWHRNFKNEFPRGSVHAGGKHSVLMSSSSITAKGRKARWAGRQEEQENKETKKST